MLLAAWDFMTRSFWPLVAALFLMGAQSTLFGPVKGDGLPQQDPDVAVGEEAGLRDGVDAVRHAAGEGDALGLGGGSEVVGRQHPLKERRPVPQAHELVEELRHAVGQPREILHRGRASHGDGQAHKLNQRRNTPSPFSQPLWHARPAYTCQ